ncbi:MAG TPA: AAA family ATPase [Verrucomicrobiae bacterium]
MSTQRYPVLVWRDAAGWVTASLVADFESAVAYAGTEAEALNQLKDLLHWRHENMAYLADPDISEPTYFEVKVEVRPEYLQEKRPIPAPDSVWLRVPCVSGLDTGGMRVCCIPHLDFTFNYQESESLKGLVAHYVKDRLRGMHPTKLFLKLPPAGCELRELTVRTTGGRTRAVAPLNRPELKLLFKVADPVVQSARGKPSLSAAYGRDQVVETLVRKLSIEKANVLLVGETGIGKSTVLTEAAKRISRAEQPEEEDRELRAFRFWRTSGARVIAGMAYLGEWQERCEEMIQKLNAIQGVLCAENLLELVRVGGQGAGDSVAAFLLPYLQRGELRLCGEATPVELESCRRLFPALLDIFQIIQVPRFADHEALDVLTKIANSAASGQRVEFEPQLPSAVFRLFQRFQSESVFPGKAATFMRQLFQRKKKTELAVNDAVELFIQQTGLPEIFLRDDLVMHAEAVRAHFDELIIGQSAATQLAARLITTIKAGLVDPQRPFGVLLFTGPTGVGKTALAKTISEYCFGAGEQKDRLIRLDMSEYSGWGAAHRLLNTPENRPAAWIERVRAQPFCVVLFDEIEKADPEVFDVLLGLLDEGRLTDQFGRVTNFRSAIVVLTSNLGSTSKGAAGFSRESGPAYQDEVARFFRPEFFNRLDAVLEFRPLTPQQVEEITRKELSELAAREGFTASGIRLEWSDEVVLHLARKGYDQRLGARPLQRAIESLVATPLARWRVMNPKARDVTLRLAVGSGGKVSVNEMKTGRALL